MTSTQYPAPNDQPIPEYMQNRALRLIFFGGKGGCGKTTMAATAALHLARSRAHRKVLVISTDPAHSLSDSFGMHIGDQVTSIQGADVSNLFARELDANRLLKDFKQKNDAVIKKLANRGTYFDQKDIADFLNLSLPGMDEVMAIIEMANLLKEHVYDVLIVDTAPTGHTVRMLNLPDQMLKWIKVMDLMQHKHRYMFRHFTGKKYVKDECDIFLDDFSSDIRRAKKLLSNRDETRFVPVMIPEPMSIYETKRLVHSLEKIHVPVKEVVVNHVVKSDMCRFCRSKKEDQKQPLMEIDNAFSTYDRIQVPLFANEIRGLDGLKRTANYLLGHPIHSTSLINLPPIQESIACLSLNPDLEFILFGGKGGVGKTSMASAAGLHLAQQYPEKKIFVFSTDPAHSLSDSLKIQIGDTITPIEYRLTSNDKCQMTNTNLFAQEIDADRLWTDFKDAFQKNIEEIFDHFMASGTDIKFDREVMTEILELAPPGLDEIMALDKIMDIGKAGEFDIFVLDTSPTGHLIRFLELPHLVREWLQSFFRLLLKYKGVVRLTGAAEKALNLSKNVRKIQETLVNPQKTGFVAITIPEAMGFLELERLVDVLESVRIPCKYIAVNKVIPQTDCAFCSVKGAEQQGYIKKINSRFSGRTIVQAPLFSRQVRGLSDLKEIAELVFCEG